MTDFLVRLKPLSIHNEKTNKTIKLAKSKNERLYAKYMGHFPI